LTTTPTSFHPSASKRDSMKMSSGRTAANSKASGEEAREQESSGGIFSIYHTLTSARTHA
jgi:hypothetical protein